MREGQLCDLKVKAFLSSGAIRDWTLGKTSSQSCWAQEQASQGGGGVPILEVFKRNGDVVLRGKVSGLRVLRGLAVLGCWLDLVILRAFSDLNESVIL